MVEIVGVVPYKRKYKIGNTYTTKALRIPNTAGGERDQCMDVVSNSRITQGEYQAWKAGRRIARAEALTLSDCKARRQRMLKIVQGHKYSSEEVRSMVSRREDDGSAYKNIALGRIKLTNLLDAAEDRGDQDAADKYRVLLAKVRLRTYFCFPCDAFELSV
ncbi:unnamed protein product [Choristocarpus tenellus]